jgi:hypothetical protein
MGYITSNMILHFDVDNSDFDILAFRISDLGQMTLHPPFGFYLYTKKAVDRQQKETSPFKRSFSFPAQFADSIVFGCPVNGLPHPPPAFSKILLWALPIYMY